MNKLNEMLNSELSMSEQLKEEAAECQGADDA